MKTTLKRIITVVLCVVLALTSTRADTAYAASKLPPLKMTFNGKTLEVVKVLKNGEEEFASLEAMQKKWGKQTKKGAGQDGFTQYVWKKGKTTFDIMKYAPEGEEPILCHPNASIKDKNGAICGIKVGMKKAAVLKKLRKMYGKNNVCVSKEGQVIAFKKGIPTPEGKATGDGELISVFAYSTVMGLNFWLKNGKVTSISFSG